MSACAGQPGGNWLGINTPSDAGSLPTGYEEMVRSFIKSRLKDPYSAVIQVGAPSISSCAIGIYGPFHGWAVPVTYNAKNSFGAYVGEQSAYVWFANGTIKRFSDSRGLCP
jgi:hypothetical protein